MESQFIILLIMASTAFLFTRLIFFNSKYLAHRSLLLPAFYDINVSLSSNISKVRSMQQLLQLHDHMHRYFNSQHLAFASRQLVKFIGIHQKKTQSKAQYIPMQNVQSWEKLLKSIYKIDPSVLLCAELIDFSHFLYKMSFFRMPTKQLFPSLEELRLSYKLKIIKAVSSQDTLKEMKFSQLVSLLFNLINIEPIYSSDILKHITVMLKHKPFCTCFHIILLNKSLQLIEGQQLKVVDQRDMRELKELMNQILMEQIEVVRAYINHRTIIQIYNIVVQTNSKASFQLLSLLLERVKGIMSDDAMYQSFFQIELKLSIKNIKKNIYQAQQQILVNDLLKILDKRNIKWMKSTKNK